MVDPVEENRRSLPLSMRALAPTAGQSSALAMLVRTSGHPSFSSPSRSRTGTRTSSRETSAKY